MRGIRDKSKTGRAAAVPCVRFFFGLLRAFVWLRSLPNARGGENGRLPLASRRFLRTAHCLGRTAAQSVRHPLGNPSGAAEPAVSRLRAALSGRNCASMPPNPFRRCKQDLSLLPDGLQAYPPVFLMETAETSCRSMRVGAVVPMPGRGIPAVIQLYALARRGVGLPPAELPKAEKIRIRRVICTMRRLLSAKRTVKPKRQAAERGGAGAFAFTVPLRRVRIAVAASGCVEEKSLTEFLPPIGWRGMPQRIGCAISVRPPPRSSLSRFVSQSARRAGLLQRACARDCRCPRSGNRAASSGFRAQNG